VIGRPRGWRRWSSVDDIGAPVSVEICPGPRQFEKTLVPGTSCLLSPDTYGVPAHGVCSMALAKHFAVAGGDGQRSGWHLADLKVGRQYGACLCEIGSRPEGGFSSSVLDDQAGGGDCDQQRCAGEYGALSVFDTVGSNDQDQQDDQACENVHDRRRRVRPSLWMSATDVGGGGASRLLRLRAFGGGTANHAASIAQPRQIMIMINGRASVPACDCQDRAR
jgi:hypothetical protein